jgi:hypothetical protein
MLLAIQFGLPIKNCKRLGKGGVFLSSEVLLISGMHSVNLKSVPIFISRSLAAVRVAHCLVIMACLSWPVYRGLFIVACLSWPVYHGGLAGLFEWLAVWPQ